MGTVLKKEKKKADQGFLGKNCFWFFFNSRASAIAKLY